MNCPEEKPMLHCLENFRKLNPVAWHRDFVLNVEKRRKRRRRKRHVR